MLYISLRQYEYIVAVAQSGSLTQAAAILNVSQPSLSVAITRVEHRLGQPVFARRKGASIDVTPYGHTVIKAAQSILKRAQLLEKGPDQPPPFVVGCFEDIAPWYLAPALQSLEDLFPKTIFQAKEGRFSELSEGLALGHVDVAISYDVGFEGNFNRKVIQTIAPVAFVAPDHPCATLPSVELSELARYPLLLFDEDLSEGFVRGAFDRVRLQPKVSQRVTSLEMMRSLAANGFGIGISYTHPPGDISYDGKPVVTVPISTEQAAADIVVLWSSLRPMDREFEAVIEQLSHIGIGFGRV